LREGRVQRGTAGGRRARAGTGWRPRGAAGGWVGPGGDSARAAMRLEDM
jgi:hypothetical protein